MEGNTTALTSPRVDLEQLSWAGPPGGLPAVRHRKPGPRTAWEGPAEG